MFRRGFGCVKEIQPRSSAYEAGCHCHCVSGIHKHGQMDIFAAILVYTVYMVSFYFVIYHSKRSPNLS